MRSTPNPLLVLSRGLLAACGLALLASSSAAQATHFVDVNAPGPGDGTFQDPYPAIQDAIDSPLTGDGDLVFIRPGTYAELVDLSGKRLHLRSTLGAAVTFVDASAQFSLEQSVLKVRGAGASGSSVNGLTLMGGAGSMVGTSFCGGGVLLQDSDLALWNCVLELNEADVGGGIHAEASSLVLDNCQLVGNESFWFGGGVHAVDSDLTLIETTFLANRSASAHNGSGLSQHGGTLDVTESLFDANESGHAWLVGVQGTVKGTTWRDGSLLLDNGAAVLSEGSELVFEDCTFEDNEAGDIFDDREGGAVFQRFGSLTLDRCVFRGNRSSRGGALHVDQATAVVRDSTFEDNRCRAGIHFLRNQGGAISALQASLTVTRCHFLGNAVHSAGFAEGGALWCDRETTWVRDCTFTGNLARRDFLGSLRTRGAEAAALGGAVFGPATVVGSSFVGNAATVNPLLAGRWAEGGALHGVRLARDSELVANFVQGTLPGADVGAAAEDTRLACCSVSDNLPANVAALGPNCQVLRRHCAAGGLTGR